MAFHNLVRLTAVGISLLLVTEITVADEPPKAHALTPKEIADGWLMLFDGESAFGWKIDGEATVKDGVLIVGGKKPTTITTLATFVAPTVYLELVTADGDGAAGGNLHMPQFRTPAISLQGVSSIQATHSGTGAGNTPAGPVRLEVPAGTIFHVRKFAAQPTELKPLFNGTDLTGWRPFTGDPKRERSQFGVTEAGELFVKNGPGDLQTEKQFADFILQLDCKTNGKWLNSGIFFRCLPGQYQQGYEAQIHNGFKGNDRTQPVDFGTGAIYRRVPARKVVANDNDWFTMTVLAHGPHITTWVNGYPVVSWTDDRPPADNARQGLYTKPGPISIQGHDPTTDLLFRNIRIGELKLRP